MYCSKCGNQIADGSRFCSFCGAPVAEVNAFAAETPKTEEPVVMAEPKAEPDPEPVRRPFIEEINWNVNEYPTTDTIEKTDDIDFDWGADPAEIRERLTREYPERIKEEIIEKADVHSDGLNVEDLIPSKPAPQQPAAPQPLEPEEEISTADKIDKFYTFSRKNEEFQQLLNREYDKIKGGSPIEQEKAMADKVADEKFESRTEDPSMEAFLDREGVNKPYEPKAFESDVLQRIEAHEKALEQARAEEEARQKMIEEERAKAAEEMRAAEEARLRAEAEERERLAEEARARAAEEVRRAEEAAKIAAEEAARAEEEAARLEAEAAAKLAAEEEAKRQEDARRAKEAVEEARRKAEERAKAEAEEKARAEEEARRKAEEEARAKAEEEARRQAEEEARRKEAEEEARRQAEEEARAREQAEKIRAQQEARQAATEKEKRIAEIERRRQEEEQLRQSLSKKQENLRLQAESAAAAEEARKVLAQTAKMREEEAAKIRAAIAGLKGETVSEPKPAPAPAPVPEVAPAARPVSEPTIKITPEMFKNAGEPVPPALDRPTLVAKPEEPAPKPAPAPAPQPESAPQNEQEAKMDAHKATQADLSKMAKARAQFLAEYGIDPLSGKAPEKPEVPEKPAEPVPATVEELLGEKPVTSRNTMLSDINENIHTKAVNREDVLKGLEDTIRISKEELKATPAISAEELEATPLTDINQIQHTKTVEEMLESLSSPAAASELGAVIFGGGEKAASEKPAETAEPEETAAPAQEEPVVPMPEVAEPELVIETPEPAEVEPEPAFEGFAEKEEPAIQPDDAAMAGLKPGLSDTVVMTGMKEQVAEADNKGADDSFADYGEKEAQQLRELQEAEAGAAAAEPEIVAEEAPEVEAPQVPVGDTIAAGTAAAAAVGAATAAVSKADEKAAKKAEKQAAKEAKRAAKEAAKEEKAEEKPAGGAGRTILKILLIILIIIFIIELAGIGIKWLAPDSGAAEFIDHQLNNVIQLITGNATDYEVPGIDYEV